MQDFPLCICCRRPNFVNATVMPNSLQGTDEQGSAMRVLTNLNSQLTVQLQRQRCSGKCRLSRQSDWDDEVYSRVFMAYESAVGWWRCNHSRGCPSQPFHMHKFIARTRQKANKLAASTKDYLGAIKCSAMAQAALQQHSTVLVTARHALPFCY